MARIAMPSTAEMSPEQEAVCAETISGIRGRVPAPMIAWLRNPELARRAQSLGELLRYQTSLPPHLSELAILVTGRHWTAHYEWVAHKREALKAGVAPGVIDAIAARREPDLGGDAKAEVVYAVARSLLTTHRLPTPLYERALTVLSEATLAELVAMLGYYSLVAMTLNAFEIGLPDAVAPELNDPDMVAGAT